MLSFSRQQAIFLIMAFFGASIAMEGFASGPQGFPDSFVKANKDKRYRTEGFFRSGFRGIDGTYELEKRWENYGAWGPGGNQTCGACTC